MKNYYFSTKKMCVGYDGKPLIKDIEINLPRGEILTLIGPNGAGKSKALPDNCGCWVERYIWNKIIWQK